MRIQVLQQTSERGGRVHPPVHLPHCSVRLPRLHGHLQMVRIRLPQLTSKSIELTN